MIIAIDGYEANVKNRVGIGRYAYEILKHMYLLRSAIRFIIYLPNAPLPDMPLETPWWQYRVVKPARLWTFIGFPLGLLRDYPRADVIFSPTHYIPRFTNLPRVMAIMDLSYLEYPELFKPKDLYQLRYWTAYSVKHAAKIFTISQFSKNAIIKAYHVPDDRVAVMYPGLSMESKVKSEKSKVIDKYNISSHYILSVGTLQPRKNYVRLIEAFSLLKHDARWADVQLIIVGKKGWLYDDILAAPDRFGVADGVRFLDFVPDDDLPGLYRHARCFVLASLYEGFGLPVLEAMAESCPVVVSRVSSLPEIAGSAGIYVDPMNVSDIAKGLERAVSEDQKARKHRIDEGLLQIKKFSWEKAAKKTLEVLEDVGRNK